MNDKLKSMVVAFGLLLVGGVTYTLYTPHPATRTIAELKDAGIDDGTRVVLSCPERITPQTRRRLKKRGFSLRKSQQYAQVARVAVVFDGGVVVPSLRRNIAADYDAGADDGGEADDEDIDDALQFQISDCIVSECAGYQQPNLADGGWPYRRPNGTQAAFCGGLNRLLLVAPACVVPNCWLDGGAWVDDAVVDCQRLEVPLGGGAPAPRWAGCNVMPAPAAVGTQCLPSSCSVVAGDPPDWL